MPAFALTLTATPENPWITFEGGSGPGKGKHIVFLAGDEEYRSEEGLPQLARILARRHGFRCTVLFSINERGEIDPDLHDNQPGIEALDKADLCILLLRFRSWPEAQMKHFVEYYRAGKPFIALRTSTHAFDFPADSKSPYADYGWRSQRWPGGFGKQVLGENWVTHWGDHGVQATLGIPETISSPLFKGVGRLFGTTDVYEASPPADATVLFRGAVLSGLNPSDPPATHRKKTVGGVEQPVNEPMMPIVWIRERANEAGRKNKIFTTTMGAATDLLDENLRRLLVNAAYWATGMEKKIPAKANVEFVGDYQPSPFGFGKFKKGVKPADLAMGRGGRL